VNGLKTHLSPTPQAIANTYEIATLEYPKSIGLNPMTLWISTGLKSWTMRGLLKSFWTGGLLDGETSRLT
jgi:hypothetical protein